MEVNKSFIILSNLDSVVHLEDLLNRLPFINYSYRSKSLQEATELIKKTTPDIIFTDTLTLSIEEIRKLDISNARQIPIVLLSDDSTEATNLYSEGVISDFLIKPLTIDRLMRAFTKWGKLTLSSNGVQGADYVFLKMGRIFKKFLFNDIIYLEAYGIYVKVFTTSGSHLINERISKLEEKFIRKNFMRVHKSYIINTTKIESFNSTSLELPIAKIPIGSSYRSKFRGLLKMLTNEDPSMID
jgi:DNA-binding LytR/AlgR family response regulator